MLFRVELGLYTIDVANQIIKDHCKFHGHYIGTPGCYAPSQSTRFFLFDFRRTSFLAFFAFFWARAITERAAAAFVRFRLATFWFAV